jgi:hypothetical protein
MCTGGVCTGVLPRRVRRYEMPWLSAIANTSWAVWLASDGRSTVLPVIARRAAMFSHLRRPVLADRHPGVRPAQPQVGPRHRGHPDEVERPGEKGAERGANGTAPPACRRRRRSSAARR